MPWCHNCNKYYASHGIARHRTMHKERHEKVTISLASGAWVYDYTEPAERQQTVDAETSESAGEA